MKKFFRISGILVLFLGVAAYIVYAMAFMPRHQDEACCSGIILNISDDSNADFISRQTIINILHEADLNPVGRKLKDIDLSKMEQLISGCQYARSVECYKTSGGKIAIDVVQRTPVVFVLSDSLDGYYVDTDGLIIPNTAYAANIPVATGHISKTYAKQQLRELGMFLLDNSFWDNQIEQIVVLSDSHGCEVVELIPRVGNQTIFLGTMDDFETKLKRLRTFYEDGLSQIGWNKYCRFNLQYANQVLCEKK